MSRAWNLLCLTDILGDSSDWARLRSFEGSCYSMCGPWTSASHNLGACENCILCLRPDLLSSNLQFNKLSRWFLRTLKYGKYSSLSSKAKLHPLVFTLKFYPQAMFLEELRISYQQIIWLTSLSCIYSLLLFLALCLE